MLNDIERERSRNRDEGRRSNVRKEMKEKRREEQGRKEKGRKEGKEGLSFTLTRCTSGSKPFDTAFLNFLINSS